MHYIFYISPRLSISSVKNLLSAISSLLTYLRVSSLALVIEVVIVFYLVAFYIITSLNSIAR